MLTSELFTTVDDEKLIFDVESTKAYPLPDNELECSEPCLVIKAEAYSSNKVDMIINIKSDNEKTYMTSIKGLAPKSEVVRDSRGNSGVQTFKRSRFVITARVKSNSDNSKTYTDIKITKGNNKGAVAGGNSFYREMLCKALKPSSILLDYKTVWIARKEGTFIVNGSHPLDVEYATWANIDKKFAEITCK